VKLALLALLALTLSGHQASADAPAPTSQCFVAYAPEPSILDMYVLNACTGELWHMEILAGMRTMVPVAFLPQPDAEVWEALYEEAERKSPTPR
jgi:hypothetical protein